MSDDGAKEGEELGRVIQFPVKFAAGQADDDSVAPEMRKADFIGSDRCLHKKTTYDRKARAITCDKCNANVDPFEALLDVMQWIKGQEWRYTEMRSQSRNAQLATDVHLLRVKQGKRCLLVGRCHVSGFHAHPNVIPDAAIQLGDYVSSNRRYRTRKEGEQWTVAFYDPAHGLKEIKTAARPSLSQVRTSICNHWRWLNNNSIAAGLAK